MVGSCLFHSGYLIKSHLNDKMTRNIVRFATYKDLWQRRADSPELIIAQYVFCEDESNTFNMIIPLVATSSSSSSNSSSNNSNNNSGSSNSGNSSATAAANASIKRVQSHQTQPSSTYGKKPYILILLAQHDNMLVCILDSKNGMPIVAAAQGNSSVGMMASSSGSSASSSLAASSAHSHSMPNLNASSANLNVSGSSGSSGVNSSSLHYYHVPVFEQSNPFFITEMRNSMETLRKRKVFSLLDSYKFPISADGLSNSSSGNNSNSNNSRQQQQQQQAQQAQANISPTSAAMFMFEQHQRSILHYVTHYVHHGLLLFPASSNKYLKIIEQRFVKYCQIIREVLYMQKVSHNKFVVNVQVLLFIHCLFIV